MTIRIDPMIPGSKGQHTYTSDVLRSIAKMVRDLGNEAVGQAGPYRGVKRSATKLADKVDALATSVSLAEHGVQGAAHKVEAKARELMAS